MADPSATAGESEATRRLSVGFLGTGIMGAHMARRIAQAGHGLAVWNRKAAKAEALSAFGVSQACDAAAAAQGADAVICMLIPGLGDQDRCAHFRRPRDIMSQGRSTSLF